MKGGCAQHVLLVLLAGAICCTVTLRSARQRAERLAARGDDMSGMPVVVLVDGTPQLVKHGFLGQLGDEPGVTFLIPPGEEARVGSQARVRVEVTALSAGRQAVRLYDEDKGWSAAYEAQERRVSPQRYVMPVSPDSMGLLWPLMVPFVYGGLWLAWWAVRAALRMRRPPPASA